MLYALADFVEGVILLQNLNATTNEDMQYDFGSRKLYSGHPIPSSSVIPRVAA